MALTYGIDEIVEMTRPDNLMKGVKTYVNIRRNMGVFLQTPGFKSLVDKNFVRPSNNEEYTI